MHLYDLVEKMKVSGRCVFTTMDVSRLLGSNRSTAAVYIHRMKARKMVYPVEHGTFSICEDPFAVSSQMVFPSYVSFSSAFYLLGRMDQIVDSVYVVTSRKKKEMSYMDTRIKFVRFPRHMMFGYRKQKIGDSYVFLADLEKAAVDSLYLERHTTVSQVFEALRDGFDKRLLEDHARRMDSEAVVRRVGYLIECLGKKTALEPATKTAYTLNASIKQRGEFNSKWRLYVNEAVP